MGVTGAGKSLIGSMLASALGVEFVDGDDLHPPENVRRMASGIPLTDEDRAGWLMAIAVRLRAARDARVGLVVACSALKRAYRDLLRREGDDDVTFIFLSGERTVVADRLAHRRGHFMPPALLDSQFATLEIPSPDERVWACDIRDSPETIVAELVGRITTTSA